jgi:DNA-binding phage protein
MTVEFSSFDVANYLDDEGVVEEYLLAAAEDPDPEILLTAKSDVLRARAVNAIHKAKRGYENITLSAARPDPTISIVRAILILTVVVQVILVKSWT